MAIHEKFFNTVGTFEYYFYSHVSTLSWMLFVPYVIYIVGAQAFWVVVLAVSVQLLSRSVFGYRTQARLNDSDANEEGSMLVKRTRSLAVRGYVLAMLMLPAVILLPAANLASASLARYGLQIYSPLLALLVLTLVFALSAVSTRILGLVTRIISIPVIFVTLLTVVLGAWVLVTQPLDFSLFSPSQTTDWTNILIWVGFVFYILGMRFLTYGFLRESIQPKTLGNSWLRSRILNSLFVIKLPLISLALVTGYAISPADDNLQLSLDSFRGFTALGWQIQEANPFLSLIFISATIFLALLFVGLPNFIADHSQEGALTKLISNNNDVIDPIITARTLVFIISGIYLFFNYNLLVVLGIILILASHVLRLFAVFLGKSSLAQRFGASVLLPVYVMLFLAVAQTYSALPFGIALLLLMLTYYLEPLFVFGQRHLLRLIHSFLNLGGKVKRRESITIGQLVTTQTIVVFWLILIFAITEIVFSFQLEEFLESYRRGPLLDLGLLIVLILYYLTVIVNTYLMVPKVEHYEKVQENLRRSNQRLAEDLAERKQMESHLRYTGSHDSLTQTYTRDHILRRLERRLRRRDHFDIVFIDIDRFKRVNDLHGHLVGDRLLKDISAYLRKIFGKKASVARFGGDEFLLVVRGIEKEELLQKCEQVADYFCSDYVQEDLEISTLLRIGVYHYRGQRITVEDIVRDIDFTVRYAKSKGNKGYTIYNEEIEEIYKKRLSAEEDIATRIKNKSFSAFYQPVLDQEVDRIIGFEQLLRIHSEGRYWLPPNYIDIAEETGHIYEMGWIILEQACQKLQELRIVGHPNIYVAVNISPSQFVQSGFVQRVKSLCAQYEVEPKNLRLEIVENVMFDGSDGVRQIMNELTWSGFKLYLDDFGTGFSNMGYLKRLPIDTLKIDQSFIRTQDAAGKAVVRAMVSLSRDLSLNIIAEGVEEVAHKEFLHSLGVRNLQGYLISKPMPASEVLTFLDAYPAASK